MKQNFIQYLRASESDHGRSGFTYEGTPMKSANEPGMAPIEKSLRAHLSPQQYQQNYNEARRLLDKVLAGDRWAALRMQEAMTTSDFGVYFGQILDRSVLANYAETPYTWDQYALRKTLRDFRQALMFRFDRGASVLDGPIAPSTTTGISGTGPLGLAEITEYPMRKRVASDYTDQLYKFGALMDFSWETMINDDLDALKDSPALLGRAARRTEEKRATKLYTSSTGPNATYFSNANLNLVNPTVNSVATVVNPPLSVTALAWALIIMSSQLDLDGEPIDITGAVLVVPPALKYAAMNILRTSQIAMNDMGGTNNTGATGTSLQRLYAPNPFQGIVSLAVNYYAPIVNTTSGNTAWYLFSSPKNGRPAMQQSFLMGHEAPEMFMKSSNAIPIGEGPGSGTGMANPMDGDFDTDSIIYKIRLCLGGTLLDTKMGVASTGAGS